MSASATEKNSFTASNLPALPARPAGTAGGWQLARHRLEFGGLPCLMGIVNVTPDSFSDGGRWLDPAAAVEQGLRLAGEGAGMLDVGGESTRPGSQPVSADEQLRRVLPVVRELVRQSRVPVSVDTSDSRVARAALDAGAEAINDVTGLTGDPEMPAVVRRSGCGVCVMHMQGTPLTMQDHPHYGNVTADVLDWLARRRDALVTAGLEPARICLDPGIGFGKTHVHNLALLSAMGRFHELGCPLLVGHSRKGFIGKLVGADLAARDAGTLGVSLHLALQGVQLLRVHAVSDTLAALKTLLACQPTGTVHCYEWPRPAVAVDLVVTRTAGTGRELLLIRRRNEPFAGCWALPGGFVDPGETVEQAAARELIEETGLQPATLRQLKVFSGPGRDPRGRVISVAFAAEVIDGPAGRAGDDAAELGWFPPDRLPPLAFDHEAIIAAAVSPSA